VIKITTCTWNITTSVKNRLHVEATAICNNRQLHLAHKALYILSKIINQSRFKLSVF